MATEGASTLIGDTALFQHANLSRFTLRGYVAAIREADIRKCWPFSLRSLQQSLQEGQDPLLPPLCPPGSLNLSNRKTQISHVTRFGDDGLDERQKLQLQLDLGETTERKTGDLDRLQVCGSRCKEQSDLERENSSSTLPRRKGVYWPSECKDLSDPDSKNTDGTQEKKKQIHRPSESASVPDGTAANEKSSSSSDERCRQDSDTGGRIENETHQIQRMIINSQKGGGSCRESNSFSSNTHGPAHEDCKKEYFLDYEDRGESVSGPIERNQPRLAYQVAERDGDCPFDGIGETRKVRDQSCLLQVAETDVRVISEGMTIKILAHLDSTKEAENKAHARKQQNTIEDDRSVLAYLDSRKEAVDKAQAKTSDGSNVRKEEERNTIEDERSLLEPQLLDTERRLEGASHDQIAAGTMDFLDKRERGKDHTSVQVGFDDKSSGFKSDSLKEAEPGKDHTSLQVGSDDKSSGFKSDSLKEAEPGNAVTLSGVLLAIQKCPVCQFFESSCNADLNAHIDQCLLEAAAKDKSQLKSKTRVRKKRSIAEICSLTPGCTPGVFPRTTDSRKYNRKRICTAQQSRLQKTVSAEKRCTTPDLGQEDSDDGRLSNGQVELKRNRKRQKLGSTADRRVKKARSKESILSSNKKQLKRKRKAAPEGHTTCAAEGCFYIRYKSVKLENPCLDMEREQLFSRNYNLQPERMSFVYQSQCKHLDCNNSDAPGHIPMEVMEIMASNQQDHTESNVIENNNPLENHAIRNLNLTNETQKFCNAPAASSLSEPDRYVSTTPVRGSHLCVRVAADVPNLEPQDNPAVCIVGPVRSSLQMVSSPRYTERKLSKDIAECNIKDIAECNQSAIIPSRNQTEIHASAMLNCHQTDNRASQLQKELHPKASCSRESSRSTKQSEISDVWNGSPKPGICFTDRMCLKKSFSDEGSPLQQQQSLTSEHKRFAGSAERILIEELSLNTSASLKAIPMQYLQLSHSNPALITHVGLQPNNEMSRSKSENEYSPLLVSKLQKSDNPLVVESTMKDLAVEALPLPETNCRLFQTLQSGAIPPAPIINYRSAEAEKGTVIEKELNQKPGKSPQNNLQNTSPASLESLIPPQNCITLNIVKAISACPVSNSATLANSSSFSHQEAADADILTTDIGISDNCSKGAKFSSDTIGKVSQSAISKRILDAPQSILGGKQIAAPDGNPEEELNFSATLPLASQNPIEPEMMNVAATSISSSLQKESMHQNQNFQPNFVGKPCPALHINGSQLQLQNSAAISPLSNQVMSFQAHTSGVSQQFDLYTKKHTPTLPLQMQLANQDSPNDPHYQGNIFDHNAGATNMDISSKPTKFNTFGQPVMQIMGKTVVVTARRDQDEEKVSFNGINSSAPPGGNSFSCLKPDLSSEIQNHQALIQTNQKERLPVSRDPSVTNEDITSINGIGRYWQDGNAKHCKICARLDSLNHHTGDLHVCHVASITDCQSTMKEKKLHQSALPPSDHEKSRSQGITLEHPFTNMPLTSQSVSDYLHESSTFDASVSIKPGEIANSLQSTHQPALQKTDSVQTGYANFPASQGPRSDPSFVFSESTPVTSRTENLQMPAQMKKDTLFPAVDISVHTQPGSATPALATCPCEYCKGNVVLPQHKTTTGKHAYTMPILRDSNRSTIQLQQRSTIPHHAYLMPFVAPNCLPKQSRYANKQQNFAENIDLPLQNHILQKQSKVQKDKNFIVIDDDDAGNTSRSRICAPLQQNPFIDGSATLVKSCKLPPSKNSYPNVTDPSAKAFIVQTSEFPSSLPIPASTSRISASIGDVEGPVSTPASISRSFDESPRIPECIALHTHSQVHGCMSAAIVHPGMNKGHALPPMTAKRSLQTNRDVPDHFPFRDAVPDPENMKRHVDAEKIDLDQQKNCSLPQSFYQGKIGRVTKLNIANVPSNPGNRANSPRVFFVQQWEMEKGGLDSKRGPNTHAIREQLKDSRSQLASSAPSSFNGSHTALTQLQAHRQLTGENTTTNGPFHSESDALPSLSSVGSSRSRMLNQGENSMGTSIGTYSTNMDPAEIDRDGQDASQVVYKSSYMPSQIDTSSSNALLFQNMVAGTCSGSSEPQSTAKKPENSFATNPANSKVGISFNPLDNQKNPMRTKGEIKQLYPGSRQLQQCQVPVIFDSSNNFLICSASGRLATGRCLSILGLQNPENDGNKAAASACPPLPNNYPKTSSSQTSSDMKLIKLDKQGRKLILTDGKSFVRDYVTDLRQSRNAQVESSRPVDYREKCPSGGLYFTFQPAGLDDERSQKAAEQHCSKEVGAQVYSKALAAHRVQKHPMQAKELTMCNYNLLSSRNKNNSSPEEGTPPLNPYYDVSLQTPAIRTKRPSQGVEPASSTVQDLGQAISSSGIEATTSHGRMSQQNLVAFQIPPASILAYRRHPSPTMSTAFVRQTESNCAAARLQDEAVQRMGPASSIVQDMRQAASSNGTHITAHGGMFQRGLFKFQNAPSSMLGCRRHPSPTTSTPVVSHQVTKTDSNCCGTPLQNEAGTIHSRSKSQSVSKIFFNGKPSAPNAVSYNPTAEILEIS